MNKLVCATLLGTGTLMLSACSLPGGAASTSTPSPGPTPVLAPAITLAKYRLHGGDLLTVSGSG